VAGPVRLVLSREEEFLLSFTRMHMVAHLRLGARADGRLLGLEAQYYFAAGAWADNGIGMADNARNGVTGAYVIPHVQADCYCVYTNHPGGGSYRGYGMPEVHWALESHLDELALRLGLDPYAVRRLNGLQTGSELPTGGRLHASGLHACLEQVADALDWGAPLPPVAHPKRRGRGLAAVLKGPHGPTNLAAAATIKFNADGSADVVCGAVEMGQGATTALAQIAAAELGLPVELVRVQPVTDTAYSPYDWKSVGSRTTWMVGNAVAAAARDARDQALAVAAAQLECAPGDLTVEDAQVCLDGIPRLPLRQVLVTGLTDAGGGTTSGPIVGRGSFAAEGLERQDPETGYSPKVKPYYTLGAQGVDLEVDVETGHVRLLRVAAAFDVGRAINPDQVEGQITGGTAQGLSTALFEEMVFPDGCLANGNLVDYKIMTAPDSPREWAVSYVEVPQADGPFGARGIAEPPIVGAAPAVGNALRQALGVRFTDLPLSPERIALKLAGGGPEDPAPADG
jgi:CO/xanthine dehydrogenase Mo-binding subunit